MRSLPESNRNGITYPTGKTLVPLRPARDESSETHQTYSHCSPSGVARSFLASLPACLSYRQPFGFQCFRMSMTFWLQRSFFPIADGKVTAIFFNCKKNLKKYLISLIIKHLQSGIFAVKRFNRRAVRLVALPVLRWRWLPVQPPTHARTTTGYLLKRFVLGSRHPGGSFVLRRMQEAKIKRFNRLCYVYIMLSCM